MAASKDRRTAAARKRATVKAQERTRRTMSTPGKTSEAGVTAASVAKLAGAVAKRVTKSTKPKPAAKPKPSTPKPTKAAQERAKAAARVKKREDKRTAAAVKADKKRRKNMTPSQRTAEAKSIQEAKDRMIRARSQYEALERRSPTSTGWAARDAYDKQLKAANDAWLKSKRTYDDLVKYRNPKIYGS